MRGRDFLIPAREALKGTTPAHRRAAIIHAYYALLLECREFLVGWGVPPPSRHQVHAQVRLQFVYASHPELHQIGIDLDWMSQRRNKASYDLTSLSLFASSTQADDDVKSAAARIAVLDTIEADPALRAAAIASLPP